MTNDREERAHTPRTEDGRDAGAADKQDETDRRLKVAGLGVAVLIVAAAWFNSGGVETGVELEPSISVPVPVFFTVEDYDDRPKAEHDFNVFREHCSDLFTLYSQGIESIDVFGDSLFASTYPATAMIVSLKDDMDFFEETNPYLNSSAVVRWAIDVSRSSQHYYVLDDGIAFFKNEHAQPLCGWYGYLGPSSTAGFYSFASRQPEPNPY